ncbi:uncharacterized protein LOC107013254 [Solanum pennellii]|uniref:Uncharacterized protein LOC107013254 n=1 Tax=Solanum pennellii TaxID=28526 RepID=A0ABM1GBJ5_SOLPN|nr:uncharacterized protein LOC107013254 [Solanum pennellii]
MVHDQQVEETSNNRMIEDARKAKAYEGSVDRVSNPKSQKGRSGCSPSEKPTCTRCGKKHVGECLAGTGNCFGCDMICHKVRDCPNIRGQEKGSGQCQASGSNSDVPRKNHFYALRSRGDQEESLDVVTGMLQVFTINAFALLDPSATFSFVIPVVAMKFDILPDILIDPFLVTTPVGDSVIAKRVY